MDKMPLLSLQGISKSFGGIKALQNISLTAYRGEVLSVVGENGAGKSTLMKIIAGVLQPDAGRIEFEGSQVNLSSTHEAAKLEISIVYQEPNIFAELSVLENIFIGEEIKTRLGGVAWGEMYRQAREALKLVDLPESTLTKKMGDLSIGTQQLVLIARGLHRKSKLLILDEPTSILSQAESVKLFKLIEDMKANGVSILYISHRIPEILRISDNIVVLRDGQITEYLDPAQATEGKIIAAMSGREINVDVYRPRDYSRNEPILRLNKLSRSFMYQDVSLEIRPGEILGLYGLIGSGRSEVARTIFGEMPFAEGEIWFDGQKLTKHTTRDAARKGIYYVPEDRGTQGTFALHSVKYNLSAVFLPWMSNAGGVIKRKHETDVVQQNIDKYSIKTNTQDALITSLSGGGQQKVILARWLINKPKLLILDEPTRGIDMKTKTEIHELIISLAESGVAIMLISSDLPEVMRLSDRVLAMHKGRIVGAVDRDELTEEKILRLALGLAS